MRIFSYRNKRTLRRIALIALLAAVLLGLLILARISYLGRYVVYSPNGVYFDKTQKLQRTPQTPEAPADAEDYPFETILSAAAEETDVDPNAVQLQGFYISTTMLANSVDEVRQALAAEAALIRERLPRGGAVIALCVEGKPCSSEELSRRMADFGVAGRTQLTFLIGGSFGLDETLKREADWRLSMSPMTFPHHMARVMLLEQVYRAYQIAVGTRYHK